MHKELPITVEWARAKWIRHRNGFSAPQLARYAQAGLIRTSHIRRPGQTKGIRLFNVRDIDRMIFDAIEAPSKHDDSRDPAVPGGPRPTPAERIQRRSHRRKIQPTAPERQDQNSNPNHQETQP